MRGINRVMLIGNLGREPEIQYLDGKIPVVKLPLATTETFKDKSGNQVSQTEWHTIVLWRGLAELAQKFLHKGSLVFIEGKLRTRTWEDKEKIKRTSTEIVADNLVMLDKRKDSDYTPGYNTQGSDLSSGFSATPDLDIEGSGSLNRLDDDMPF
ncbi:MAG: single-stranded DNA-binding protein [Bacteroidetes bacterium]|nr:single-stranded DNA-binding protein [Bacteroidota bacterium]MBS1776436.1 single-stranded DNA-binding protein [Bacteroidota bacterium]